MGKANALAVGLAGYVLGARAGRGRYEQIASTARRLWRDPRVEQRRAQATTAIKDTVSDASQQAVDAVRSRAGSSDTPDGAVDAGPDPLAHDARPVPDPRASARGAGGDGGSDAFPRDPGQPG